MTPDSQQTDITSGQGAMQDVMMQGVKVIKLLLWRVNVWKYDRFILNESASDDACQGVLRGELLKMISNKFLTFLQLPRSRLLKDRSC